MTVRFRQGLVDAVRRRPRLMALPAAVVVGVTLIAVSGTPWHLTGDFAHTELLVRAIPRHPPLIGVAARVRDQGSTPGPSMAYLLYPVYKLLGSSALALMTSVNVLHVVAIVGSIALAKRVGGLPIAAFVALTMTAVVVGLAPRFFLEPWNVWVPLFAFGFFIVAIWAVVCDHVAVLPVAVAVGSHCVQTHISYTLLVTGLLAGAAAWVLWRWLRHGALADRHPARWLAVSVVVLVIAWLPPLIEQARPGTGNLRKIYEQFTDPGEPFVGPRAALKAMVGRFNVFGPWIIDTGKDPRSTPNYVGFVLFVAVVGGAMWFAWKRRHRVEVALHAVLTAATILGFVSTTRIFGDFFEYVIRWMTPLVAMWIAAALWSWWLTLSPRWADVRRAAVPVLLAGAAAITITGVVRSVGADIPYHRDSDITARLAAAANSSLDRTGRYQIDEFDPVALGSVAFGLQLDLEKLGAPAGVGPWGRSGVMPFRVVTDDAATATLWYVATQPVIDAFMALPSARLVASVEPRTAHEQSRSAELEAELDRRLCESGHPEWRSLLHTRWGDTALDLQPDLPSDIRAVLRQYVALRQNGALIELPVGVGATVAVPAPGPCP